MKASVSTRQGIHTDPESENPDKETEAQKGKKKHNHSQLPTDDIIHAF